MKLREAAQQLLEALGLWSTGRDMDAVALNDLIFRLEAALAEPVQEPPCATRECMPSQCPNCASLQDQNTELDRKLAELEAALRAQP